MIEISRVIGGTCVIYAIWVIPATGEIRVIQIIKVYCMVLTHLGHKKTWVIRSIWDYINHEDYLDDREYLDKSEYSSSMCWLNDDWRPQFNQGCYFIVNWDTYDFILQTPGSFLN